MLEALRRLNGLFVGQLTEDELELFSWGVCKGYAREVYEGASGFLGLGKVKVTG